MNPVKGDTAGGQRVFLASFCWRGIPAELTSLKQVQETTYKQVVIFLGATWHRISVEYEDAFRVPQDSCVVNECKHT